MVLPPLPVEGPLLSRWKVPAQVQRPVGSLGDTGVCAHTNLFESVGARS